MVCLYEPIKVSLFCIVLSYIVNYLINGLMMKAFFIYVVQGHLSGPVYTFLSLPTSEKNWRSLTDEKEPTTLNFSP